MTQNPNGEPKAISPKTQWGLESTGEKRNRQKYRIINSEEKKLNKGSSVLNNFWINIFQVPGSGIEPKTVHISAQYSTTRSLRAQKEIDGLP